MIVPYVLFFVAGVGFGYAAPGAFKLMPLLFPILLAAGAVLSAGFDPAVVARLAVALIVTVIGILLGAALGARGERQAAEAES